ncbi:MAG: FAD:protein FMN transferase [Lachnospiraceae bacterium]|nr:FAD:protein FMN transferase [Lachnospiraceae bacterium]
MKNALTVPQKTLTLLLCLFMTVSVLGGCGRREPFVRTLFALDTVVSVTYYDSRDAEAIAKIPERLEYYEGIFSRTRKGSELYEINARLAEAAAEGLTDVRLPLSLEMYQALSLALEYARLTDGAFDPTLGRLSELYNFSGSQHTVPSEAQRTEILSHCGYENLRVENAPSSAWPWHLTVEDPAIVIDLGGMAKGYIADRLKEELLAEGVTGAILNLGGNVLVLGKKPDGGPYTVGVAKPEAGSSDYLITFPLSDASAVTSGSYQRFFEENGVIYHHILDPGTGLPAQSGLKSVTVVAECSAVADILSTALFVMGKDAGTAFLEGFPEIEVYFVDEQGALIRD